MSNRVIITIYVLLIIKRSPSSPLLSPIHIIIRIKRLNCTIQIPVTLNVVTDIDISVKEKAVVITSYSQTWSSGKVGGTARNETRSMQSHIIFQF